MHFLILTSFVAAAFVASARAGRAETAAEALLARAIKAHGGEKALARHKAVRLKLRLTEAETHFTYNHEWLVAAPNRLKDTGDGYYLGRRIVTTYATDGKVARSFILGKLVTLDGKQAEWYKDRAHLMQVMRLVPLKEKHYHLQAAGETKVDGKTAVGLLVHANGHKDITLYFDSQTSLVVMVEHKVTDSSGEEVTEQRFYRDYPKKDPVPYARKVIVKQGGKTVEQLAVVKVQLLEKVDDREFRRK
jgi:hypothetical protein